MFKIATWNVNSLKIRLPQVLDWLAAEKPHVFALQEIKSLQDDFFHQAISDAGYHITFSGQKAYNGVAVFSREPVQDIVTDFPEYNDIHRRILAVTMDDKRVINLYIPNGQSVESEKYIYKLEWLSHLKSFLKNELLKHKKILVLGDFNIAPNDDDVHDPIAWKDSVLCSDKERQAFQDILNLGFKDCFRLHKQEEKSYSWWDYRLNAFKRNLGLRIDHILVNEAFAKDCAHCRIDKSTRSHERPSDHAVVVAEFS